GESGDPSSAPRGGGGVRGASGSSVGGKWGQKKHIYIYIYMCVCVYIYIYIYISLSIIIICYLWQRRREWGNPWRILFLDKERSAPFPVALQYRVDAWSGRSKPLFRLPVQKIHLIYSPR